MEAVLAEGIARAEAAGLLGEQYGIGIGMCGYGEGTTSTARIEQIVAEVADAHPYALVNDVESAWAAGLNLADGIVIIAGTGSIAYGVHGERSLRCGGWDYELGDEGSGGWLGKELLRASPASATDATRLGPCAASCGSTRACDHFDIIAFAQEHMANRSRISALAPLVSKAAAAGDASAQRILERGATEEAEMVAAIVHSIFDEPMIRRRQHPRHLCRRHVQGGRGHPSGRWAQPSPAAAASSLRSTNQSSARVSSFRSASA